jgi:thiol-disulfide isomerase/thioredoxin
MVLLLPDRPTLVWFFMNGCPHCERMEHAWSEVSEVAQSTGVAHVQQFEASDRPDLMQKYDISGYPTVKMFWADGRQETYRGDRSSEDLLKFVTRVPPTADPQSTVPRLIFLHMKGCFHCNKMQPAWKKVVGLLRTDPAVVTEEYEAYASPEVMEKFQVEGFPTLLLVSPSGNIRRYHGNRTAEDILAFSKQANGH